MCDADKREARVNDMMLSLMKATNEIFVEFDSSTLEEIGALRFLADEISREDTLFFNRFMEDPSFT